MELGWNYARFRGDVLMCVQSIMSYMREVEYPLYPPESLPIPESNRFDADTAVEVESGSFHKVVSIFSAVHDISDVSDIPEFVKRGGDEE